VLILGIFHTLSIVSKFIKTELQIGGKKLTIAVIWNNAKTEWDVLKYLIWDTTYI
jgi:hypothetical protein